MGRRDEDAGGWFSQGEILLRGDGVLFTRSVTRDLGFPDGQTSAWRRDDTWTGGPDVRALLGWLASRG